MSQDERRTFDQTTQSGQTPGIPAPEAVTGLHPAMNLESTGKYHPIGVDSDVDTGKVGGPIPRPSNRKSHELTSGPPTIPGYDIIGELGRGGMGVVYKAWHVPTRRFVALKMILTGAAASDSHRKRFRIESEAVARLTHPNIIQIYEVGELDGQPYFSLEFCGGSSLANKLSGNPMLPQAAALILEKMARAVAIAHTQKIIHRDLKPANILLSSEGEPKISDFGLAKRLGSDDVQTRAGAIMGTPSYMPPEQAIGDGDQIGPAADIYALGAILYECLTGRPPFKSATAADTLDQVRRQDPVAPRLLNATVPDDLNSICLKCLRKLPQQRYSSAAELADELRRYLSGEPILTKPPSWAMGALRWFQERPFRGILLLLAAAAIIGAASKGIISFAL